MERILAFYWLPTIIYWDACIFVIQQAIVAENYLKGDVRNAL